MRFTLQRLLHDPFFEPVKLPSYVRSAVQKRPDGEILVWLTAFLPERRGEKIDMIEEPLSVPDAVFRLRIPGSPLCRVQSLNGEKTALRRVEDGVVEIQVSSFSGWCLLRVTP